MRPGWSCKEAAEVLGISVTRVTQSLDPTLERIAILWRADASKTMTAILHAVDNLEPMSEAEISLRERISQGRADRSELRQKPPTFRDST